jgi:hypothetical protein
MNSLAATITATVITVLFLAAGIWVWWMEK